MPPKLSEKEVKPKEGFCVVQIRGAQSFWWPGERFFYIHY